MTPRPWRRFALTRPSRSKALGVNEDTGVAGLCDTCIQMRKIVSDRGSVFYLCGLSKTDPSFPRYPRLPVLECRGYEPEEPRPAESQAGE
jgi:hypothetical protein